MDSPSGPFGPPPPAPTAQAPPPPMSPDSGHVRHDNARGAGASVGIVLILIGMALLVAQLLPNVSILMLWPLLIIVPGLVQCFTPGHEGWTIHRFFDGLVTIAIGLIFLGNTTGVLSWGVWWQVLQLWPVLLISAGLGILGKSMGQDWIRVLGTVAVLFAFALAVTTSSSGSPLRIVGVPGGEPFKFSEPVGSVQRAELRLGAGVGEIRIDSGSDLVSIQGESPFSAPQYSASVAGSTARVEFQLTDEDGFTVYPGSTSARVDAKLSDRVVWDLEIDSGVSALDADLSDVRVNSMRLKTGVSSNRVMLGAVPPGVAEANLAIDTGVSSVTVLVPASAHVRVESESGLTGHDIAKGLVSQGGGVWQTSGYDQAVSTGSGVWTIKVKSGVGSVTVDTY